MVLNMGGDAMGGDTRQGAPSRPSLMAVATTLFVASLAWFALRLAYPFGPPALGWLPLPLGLVIAGAGAWRVTRRPDLPAPVRRYWRTQVIVVAVGLAAMGSAARDALTGPGAPSQRVGIMTAGLYILTLVLAAGALRHLPLRGRPRGEWLTTGLDVATVALAAGLGAWYFTVSQDSDVGDPHDLLALVSIVAMAVIGILVALKLNLADASGFDRRSLAAHAATVACTAFLAANESLLHGRPDLSALMVSLPVSYLGITFAAHLQRTAPAQGRRRGHRRRTQFSLLPYASIAFAEALLLFTVPGRTAGIEVTVVGSVALTALVVVRQMVASRDNTRLLAQVDASMRDLRRHERRFRSLVQNSHDIISIVDAEGRYTYISPSVQRILGFDPREWIGRPNHESVHPDDLPTLRALFTQMRLQPSLNVRTQARVIHADGSWRWMEIAYSNLLRDPSVRGFISNARDISDTRSYQDQLAYQASHDELTGLANRSLFAARTELAVTTSPPGTVAVALVDLDDFKTVNDRLGHSVGDALLVAVAGRLRACMRPDDTVARLGGDEFAILLTDLRTGESGAVAERIIATLAEPLSAAGHDLLIQASIGVADSDIGTDADDLLRRADIAMYAAKESGKSQYTRYDADLDARAVEHAQLAAELSQALDRGELHLLYQPVVHLPSGHLAGVEALVRWEHPRDGLVPPARFIPVAERTGLIVPIGAWVLRTACSQAAEWLHRHGDGALGKISVNVSARQLLEPTLPQTVARVLAETGLPAERLTVEITETAVFGGGRAVEAVAAIRALGVNIALDDFGTGHSSLGLLRTCPVDVLKVDKSFVDGVSGTVEQEAIVTSIIEIAQALGLRAIAEGVETGEQADRLHALGYRLAQGFTFSRPVPAANIEQIFAVPESEDYAPAAA
jgi:diguanylate cyclase (GGDEF)-like protein/PAS domain S-box-containing protein